MSLRAASVVLLLLTGCGPTATAPALVETPGPAGVTSNKPAPTTEPDRAPRIVLDGQEIRPEGFELRRSEGEWAIATLPHAAPGFGITLAATEPRSGLLDAGRSLTAYKPAEGGGILGVGFSDQERKVTIEILTFAPGTFEKQGTCSFRFKVTGHAADTKLEGSGIARQVRCYAMD